jgi:hypothetical protein
VNNFFFPINYIPSFNNIDFSNFIDQQTRTEKDIVSPDTQSWIFNNLNAEVLWTEVFHLGPKQSYKIHCDGHELDNKCKLNFIVNGEDSSMVWYEPIDYDKIESLYSTSNTKYLSLNKNNAKVVCKSFLNNFNLVNVGKFHTVLNGLKDRYCISIVVADTNTKERLTFDEVFKRLFKK